MSVAGLKKQFNKVNQYMSEKIGGAKGTELDDEFIEMEKKIDVMGRLVDELMARTHELLQPNPASRAKLSAVKSISKLRGQANQLLYPQPEGQLGECMIKHGRDLGDDSLFGQSLVEAGETYKNLADIKYALEDNVKQNFIEPLNHIQTKDLREVNHHRKKLSGRRLDYDCKMRRQKKGVSEKGGNVTEEELSMAEDKFEESKQLAETAMWNLLENDVEQISALASFIEAEINFHQQSADLLSSLHSELQSKITEAAGRPKREHVPKRVGSSMRLDRSPGHDSNNYLGGNLSSQSQGYSSYNSSRGGSQACCKALYDFDPENEGELGFREGDIITLTERIDENWYEGQINGQVGFFPVNYVEIIVDLPH